MSETAQNDKAYLFEVIESGFVKSLENNGDGWTVVWWNDNADEFEFTTKKSLVETLETLAEFFRGEIQYDELERKLEVSSEQVE